MMRGKLDTNSVSLDSDTRESGGFVLIVLLTAIIPLVAMAAAATITLGGRSERILSEVHQERALLSAESGIDEAIYAAKTGMLLDGYPIVRDLGQSQRFEVTPTYLMTDGFDNDSDGDLDSADPDEDVFQIVVTGRYRNIERRIVAYLGPAAILPAPQGALSLANLPANIVIDATATLIGNDTKLDDTAGTPAEDVHGIAISPPETTANVLALLDATEQSRVVGVGSAPSLVVGASTLDLTGLVSTLSTVATSSPTPGSYTGVSLGSGISYVGGNLVLMGASSGSGVLVVQGDLALDGTTRFDGVLVVTGSLTVQASARVYGAAFAGGSQITIGGSAKIVFSKEGLQIADSVSREYSKLQGWQEIER
ncbi:MAG: hypothetical protein KDC95_16510 [Planctomycetes bacterium]|nr:hypothetical protein [Planctomycetota bacterium]